MDEAWKPVYGHELVYEVSNLGQLRSLPRPLIYKDGRRGMLKGGPMRGAVGGAGYLIGTFGKEKRLVHRVVAEAFLEPQGYRRTVNHKDGNKLNNSASNLEWHSYAENNAHARATALNRQHGEATNLSKYSDQLVAAIRRVHAKYEPTWTELGELFGVDGYYAKQVVNLETRKKVTI